jgi:hypothetical protein
VLPVVTVSAATSTPVGGGASKVVIDFLNTGFLPTNGTDMAIKTKSIRAKATVSVSLPDGMDFVVRTIAIAIAIAMACLLYSSQLLMDSDG